MSWVARVRQHATGIAPQRSYIINAGDDWHPHMSTRVVTGNVCGGGPEVDQAKTLMPQFESVPNCGDSVSLHRSPSPVSHHEEQTMPASSSLLLSSLAPSQRTPAGASSSATLPYADAHSMDPYCARERQVVDALMAIRRNASAFAAEAVENVSVVIPPCPTLPLHRPTHAETPAEPSSTSHAAKKPPKGAALRSVTTPLSEGGDATVVLKLLMDQRYISYAPRVVHVRELRDVIKKLERLLTTRVISQESLMLDPGRTPTQAPLPMRTPRHNAPSKRSTSRAGQDTPDPLDAPATLLLPTMFADVLAGHLATLSRLLSENVCGFDALHSLDGQCSPCMLSRGMSLAARELALVSAQPKYSSKEISCSEDAALELLCGDFLVHRTVEAFGKVPDGSALSAFVVFGMYSPREVAAKWMSAAVQSNQKKPTTAPLCLTKAGTCCVGVGWQKHPVHGAVTVLLAAPHFEELRFMENRGRLLPMHEAARYITHGLLTHEDSAYFPIKCDIARFNIKAISPSLHPVETPSLSLEFYLQVPGNVEIACAVVQVNAPPQTPFCGRREADSVMKSTRRRMNKNMNGLPAAASTTAVGIPHEPRQSTHTCMIDYPVRDLIASDYVPGLVRLRVRLVSPNPATVHVFARQTPLETNFVKAMSIAVSPKHDATDSAFTTPPLRTDTINEEASTPVGSGLPLVTEVFHKWRACLDAPLTDTIESHRATAFAVWLPKGIQSCVLKHSSGSETPLHATVDHETPQRSLTDDSALGRTTPKPHRSSILISSLGSPPRRGVERVQYQCTLYRPIEGHLYLWADGFVLCQWMVSY